MSERKPYIAANWKMNKTIEEAEAFLGDFLPKVASGGPDVVVCPSFVALKSAVEHCAQSSVRVGAQNMHEEAAGAFTGEVSAPMLREVGVDAVILGHSEVASASTRRGVARKIPAALAAGLEPILCVGETEAQRDADDTHRPRTSCRSTSRWGWRSSPPVVIHTSRSGRSGPGAPRPRAGRGGDPLHPQSGARTRAGGGGADSNRLRGLDEARKRRRADGPGRHRWWAGRGSEPRPR